MTGVTISRQLVTNFTSTFKRSSITYAMLTFFMTISKFLGKNIRKMVAIKILLHQNIWYIDLKNETVDGCVYFQFLHFFISFLYLHFVLIANWKVFNINLIRECSQSIFVYILCIYSSIKYIFKTSFTFRVLLTIL